MLASQPRVAFLGLGNMASACLRPLLTKNIVAPTQVVGTRSSAKGIKASQSMFPKVAITSNNQEAAASADYVFLGVKPQDISEFNASLRGHLKKDAVVISMAAGVSRAQLQETLQHEAVVRCMPNMPASIGQGMIPYIYANCIGGDSRHATEVHILLSAMGRAHVVAKEIHMDMATAVAGSTPAFFLLLQEAIADAGVHMGLKRSDAEVFVAQTMLGTAELINLRTLKEPIVPAETPAEGSTGSNSASPNPQTLNTILHSIVSPGGLTAAALAMASQHRFRHTINEMVWASYRRSLEIADPGDRKIYGPGAWEPRVPVYNKK